MGFRWGFECFQLFMHHMTSHLFTHASHRSVLMPIAREFKPEIVMVSAGFDASLGHPAPLGGYCLSPACEFCRCCRPCRPCRFCRLCRPCRCCRHYLSPFPILFSAISTTTTSATKIFTAITFTITPTTTTTITTGFGHMTQELMTLCGEKVVLVLEGGYELTPLSQCASQCLKALLHLPVSLPCASLVQGCSLALLFTSSLRFPISSLHSSRRTLNIF